jgi:hypothetical protein
MSARISTACVATRRRRDEQPFVFTNLGAGICLAEVLPFVERPALLDAVCAREPPCDMSVSPSGIVCDTGTTSLCSPVDQRADIRGFNRTTLRRGVPTRLSRPVASLRAKRAFDQQAVEKAGDSCIVLPPRGGCEQVLSRSRGRAFKQSKRRTETVQTAKRDPGCSACLRRHVVTFRSARQRCSLSS